MRTGKPGTWWVLRRADEPLFWTGELVKAVIDGETNDLVVMTTEKALAPQYADRATAVMTHSLFGLAPCIVPVELEFAA